MGATDNKPIRVHHTTIKGKGLLCMNCGTEHPLKYPIEVDEIRRKIKAFNELHWDCEKTWEEPKADLNTSTVDRANWWMANGHVGASSRTMWCAFMGVKEFPIDHPLDPDDFGRCYKLLEAVPEWKARISELRKLSDTWNGLVSHWKTLTDMFEQNEREDWKVSEEVGMYELMRKIRGLK